jgi:hypothetical protein
VIVDHGYAPTFAVLAITAILAAGSYGAYFRGRAPARQREMPVEEAVPATPAP